MSTVVAEALESWAQVDAEPRTAAALVRRALVPASPSVYAWYRDGERVYVGKAANLRQRICGNHLGRGVVMTGSAFRRNVAEHLGIALAADIKAGRYKFTPDTAAIVRTWIEGCDVAWTKCVSDDAARAVEARLKRESRPPLTKR